jgi:hypothetical protein
MSFTNYNFGCDYPSSGLGFAQDFRGMDVLFSIVNEPQADHIYGFFLRWSDSTKIVENKPEDYPFSFGFDQNMPTLVRHTMKLAYNLPASCDVSIKIYDCTGRLVSTIIKERQTAGKHTVIWNCQDTENRALCNGIYFAGLQCDNGVDVRKLVLLR